MIKIRHATFRQLQVFEAVARHASFTMAADELHLTQPTLSMQMKKLQTIVGVPLYNQIGKRIYLTDTGQELLKTCHEVFTSLYNFEMRSADIQGIKKGNLNLSGVTTAEYFAPRILGDFCKKYPGINVALEVANRQHILERLEQNLDDIYIVGQTPTDTKIHTIPFLENPLVILASPNHHLAQQKNIPLDQLSQENFILREPGCGTYLSMDKLHKEQNISFKSSMALGSNEAIKQAVIGELGISLLSLYALTHEISTGEIVVLNVEGFPIKDQWYLCYPKGKQLSIVAQAFLDYMLTEGRDLTAHSLANTY